MVVVYSSTCTGKCSSGDEVGDVYCGFVNVTVNHNIWRIFTFHREQY